MNGWGFAFGHRDNENSEAAIAAALRTSAHLSSLVGDNTNPAYGYETAIV